MQHDGRGRTVIACQRLLPSPNRLPTWPAFFAARITWPTKLLSRIRPGRMRRSSSRLVMVTTDIRNRTAGARSVECVGVLGRRARRTMPRIAQNNESNQPHAPNRWRRFYLAIAWLGTGFSCASIRNLRFPAKAHEAMRYISWQASRCIAVHEQTVWLRRQCKENWCRSRGSRLVGRAIHWKWTD